MIAFKYTKIDGSEYLSHLDLLRHIYRTLRRAGIPLNYSGGFHAHPRIFLNNPLGTGIKSVAEYATIDTTFTGNFKPLFNAFSPTGVKCLDWKIVDKNQNYANCIVKCSYSAAGVGEFDIPAFMAQDKIIITDLRGREVDIRPRIYAVERSGDRLLFTLGCGGNNLRPDLFCQHLCSQTGGHATDILKTASYMSGDEFV